MSFEVSVMEMEQQPQVVLVKFISTQSPQGFSYDQKGHEPEMERDRP